MADSTSTPAGGGDDDVSTAKIAAPEASSSVHDAPDPPIDDLDELDGEIRLGSVLESG